jgi:signal transduction histidine kinase
MRLADFILENIERILAEWELFARSIPSAAQMTDLALRDHAGDILRAAAADMMSAQSASQASDKSAGHGEASGESLRLNGASDAHAIGRVGSGFDLMEVVAEYRALRASVVRLWRAAASVPDPADVDDLIRFDESIDQSLTTAVSSYTTRVTQSREMFLATLGHDLRNPLNSIAMSAQLMSTLKCGNNECAALATQISSSAGVMATMIRDLLDYTRTRLGAGMPVSRGPVDLKRIGDEVIDEFRAGHPTRTLGFRATGDTNGEWDSARLRQVLSNLLANAIQHGSESGPIELSLDGTGAEVSIAVRNEGNPIPPDSMRSIFNPLVRGADALPSSRARLPGSIGLGLYIVREVAAAHGGTVHVTSTDAGTVFTVRLPRTAHRA